MECLSANTLQAAAAHHLCHSILRSLADSRWTTRLLLEEYDKGEHDEEESNSPLTVHDGLHCFSLHGAYARFECPYSLA